MAHALELAGSNVVLKPHSKLTFRKGTYTYVVETSGDGSTYTVTDGTNSISAPIKWGFGANSQTWMLEYGGRSYESLVSYYPGANGLDITMGDQEIEPKTLLEAFGRELRKEEVTACFHCHATNAVSEYRLELNSMKAGVSCERCHEGAAKHFEAISRGSLESVPPKLKRISSEEMSNFCGQCHRSFATVVGELRMRGVVTVRFQPYRLAMSKCFDGSDARISCVACHDPHQEVVRDQKSYDSKCLACHSGSTTAALKTISATRAHAAATPVAKACPVANSGCVSCHMPKVNLPGSHMTFSDHYIRVVRENEPFPN